MHLCIHAYYIHTNSVSICCIIFDLYIHTSQYTLNRWILTSRDKTKVDMIDFEMATDRIIGGLESKKIMTLEEKRVVGKIFTFTHFLLFHIHTYIYTYIHTVTQPTTRPAMQWRVGTWSMRIPCWRWPDLVTLLDPRGVCHPDPATCVSCLCRSPSSPEDRGRWASRNIFRRSCFSGTRIRFSIWLGRHVCSFGMNEWMNGIFRLSGVHGPGWQSLRANQLRQSHHRRRGWPAVGPAAVVAFLYSRRSKAIGLSNDIQCLVIGGWRKSCIRWCKCTAWMNEWVRLASLYTVKYSYLMLHMYVCMYVCISLLSQEKKVVGHRTNFTVMQPPRSWHSF